jgi:GNAT superfamily N-acetyltransferase
MIENVNDPRAILPSEWLRLLNQGFPVPTGGSFFDDFPVWDTTRFGKREIIALGFQAEGGPEFVAGAGLRPAWLNSSAAKDASATRVRIGIIGGVVAEPAFRGQGLASKLVSALVDEAKRLGLAGVALWGSEHSLYRKLGFELSGVQRRFSLAPLSKLGSSASAPATRLGRGWTAALWTALDRYRLPGLAIEATDQSWFAAHKNVDWHWALSAEGQVIAYAAIGRGIDLPSIVHEWGGEPVALTAVLTKIAREYPQAELLASASSRVPDALGLSGANEEALCLWRPLSSSIPDSRNLWFWGLDGA